MGRLTVRLPQSLHEQLVQLAQQQGVSLNQYVVYALTRQTTLAYTVQPVPEAAIAEQQAAYAALLQQLGEASFEEVHQILTERESAEPEEGLSPGVMRQLKARFAKGE